MSLSDTPFVAVYLGGYDAMIQGTWKINGTAKRIQMERQAHQDAAKVHARAILRSHCRERSTLLAPLSLGG